MKFTLEILEEISDYIEMLDEQTGLKPETVIDIKKSISEEKDAIKLANEDKQPKDSCHIGSVMPCNFNKMTRTQAYNSMKMLGNTLTHKDFSKGEYIHWYKNQIMTEDGYDFSSQFHDKTRTRFDDGWSVL